VTLRLFLAEITRKWSEFTGKNPETFQPDYCFQVPLISGVFLLEPARIS
jgi:hypothetical protein